MTAAALLEQMKRLELTEPQVMHVLSEARLISDNCVRLWDIAEPDLSRAVRWLQTRRVRYGDGKDCNAKILV